MLSLNDLHPYQNSIIDKAKGLEGAGLFLEPGLGKTVIALALIKHYGQKALVIAPKAVALNTWTQENLKWEELKDLKVQLINGTPKQRDLQLSTDADVYVISVDLVKWLIEVRGFTSFSFLVIDESSRFKDPSTQRFKALKKAFKITPKRLILTGTPTPNGIADLWSQVAILDLGARLGKSLTAFRMTYLVPDQMNPHTRVVYKWKAKPGAEEIIQNTIKDICFSMKADDYLSLPSASHINHDIQWSSRKEYDKMKKDQVVELGDDILTAPTSATVTNKLLQITAGHAFNLEGESVELHKDKINYLEEMLEFNNQPTVIFHHYKKSKEYILNIVPDAVTEMSPENIKKWNEGKIKTLLLHPQSSGIGLNLQNNTGKMVNMIWYDLPWSSENFIQSNARVLRQGQLKPVIFHHLMMNKSMDQKVLDVLNKKINLQDALLDELKIK